MKKTEKNWLEWVVFIISTLLVIVTLGFLVYNAITGKDTPPTIKVTLGEPIKNDNHYAIPVTAENMGAQTAENVTIEVTAGEGNQQQKASLEFTYLPGKSTVNGWITFSEEPGPVNNMQIQVLGYGTP